MVEHISKNTVKTIVYRAQGKIESSTMTALIGVSGSGKTTLLNALVGKSEQGLRVAGEIFLNGRFASDKAWEKVIGFACKHFYAYESQTVEETLRFATKMTPCEVETEELVSREISYLAHILGLTRVMNTPISSISTGERTRLSLGVTLVRKPLILIMDEFAGELDSFNIMHVLRILKGLRDQGKGILISLQRPSQKMLSLFDRMILMCQGEIVFDGRLEECESFFRSCGYDLTGHSNPSDFFVETLSIDTTTEELERVSLERIHRLKVAWRRIQQPVTSTVVGRVQIPQTSGFTTSKFVTLFKRNISDFVRKTDFQKILWTQKLTTMTLLIVVYIRLGYSQEGIRNRFGLLSFIVIASFEKIEAISAMTFYSHKKAFKREVCSGMYGAVSSYFSSLLSSFCTTGIPNMMYTIVVYWAVGLNQSFWRFIFFVLVLILISFFAVALAIAISIHTRTLVQAQVLGTTVLVAFIIFGGNFVNPNSIPGFARWIIWISPVYYAFEAMLQNQLNDLSFTCDGNSREPCFTNGREFLDFYGLNRIGYKKSVSVLLFITLMMVVLGAISMKVKVRPGVTS